MRFLLDEMLDDRLVAVLNAFGHQAEHVRDAGLSGATDFELVEYARKFDAFITLDLHRQEAEWLAVNEALVSAGIAVVRIRLPKHSHDNFMDVSRSLIYRLETWTAAIAAGKVLVTIRSLGAVDSTRSRQDIDELLRNRR